MNIVVLIIALSSCFIILAYSIIVICHHACQNCNIEPDDSRTSWTFPPGTYKFELNTELTQEERNQLDIEGLKIVRFNTKQYRDSETKTQKTQWCYVFKKAGRPVGKSRTSC